MELHAIVDEGLGNSAYLVDLGDGRALAVDAGRDLRALRACARRNGLQVALAADTHLHADFLSGVRDLAAGGARVLASAAGDRQFPHEGLGEGDEVDLGGLVLRALATPGHTPEHLSYLLLDGSGPLGVFTGGSLIVGAAARTDLLGPEHTEPLARQQWQSLQRLAELPDATPVWPTHGAGSFCAAPPGAARTSTIGREKQANPLLNAGSEQAFVDLLLAGLGAFPPYFLRLGEANRLGPHVLAVAPALAALDPQEVARQLDTGALLVDVRQRAEFDSGHVRRATNVELGRLAEGPALDEQLVADGTAVMCGHGERAMTAASLLERIGARDLAVIVGGPEQWSASSGQPLEVGP